MNVAWPNRCVTCDVRIDHPESGLRCTECNMPTCCQRCLEDHLELVARDLEEEAAPTLTGTGGTPPPPLTDDQLREVLSRGEAPPFVGPRG